MLNKKTIFSTISFSTYLKYIIIFTCFYIFFEEEYLNRICCEL